MQGKTTVFTIIAKNYLPYARVLMRSAAEVHPSWRRVVILADTADDHFDPRAEDFEIVTSAELPIPNPLWFHFKYTVTELCTAVKPYAIEHLFKHSDAARVIYLDPDIRIYSLLEHITGALDERANVVLTPHLTNPLNDGMFPGDIDILRAGAYNLGFIAVARSQESQAFIQWWQQRLYDDCVVDLAHGLFVDQRWVDLAPGLFEGVTIVRDAGYNVAYWNLAHREVIRTNDGYRVAGAPLAFFHFSGYDPRQPDQLSRHQNRFRVNDLPEGTQQLLAGYREELLDAEYDICRSWPYAFAFFRNGTPLPDLGRPIHHEAPDLLSRIEDPFSDDGFHAFIEQWNSPIDGDGKHDGVSRLAYRIYRARTDVQAAMPDIFGGHYLSFLEWMMVSGRIEHGLGEEFLLPIAGAFQSGASDGPGRESRAKTPFDVLLAEMVHDAPESNDRALQLSRLAGALFDIRPELRRHFPDPRGRDRERFLMWLLTYGKREHHLSAAQVAPLKAHWREAVAALPDWRARLRNRVLLAGMAASAHLRPPPPKRAERPESLNTPGDLLDEPAVNIPDVPPPGERGVNLVGYFRSETGVGQSARAARVSLQTAGVGLSLRSVADPGPLRRDYSAGPMSTAFPYDTNLFYVNADQTHTVRNRLGPSFYRHRRNIGYWVWELDEFPARWRSAFDVYQEIWTPSTFCRDAVAGKSPVPVFRIPYSVSPAAPVGMDRQYFGLPADRFLFLMAFDVLSVVERKNPLAVIRAFEQAFGPQSGCELVIKVNHAEDGAECIQTLRSACSNGSVRILDSTLRREEMDALTNCADCVVSLHRSEGFGLVIAEAMHFGKPVVVTNYSGNIDFTLPDNSLLVNYKLAPVGPQCGPYNPTSLWADPDVDHAAKHLRAIASQKDLYGRLSGAGRSYVRQALSPETVGAAMRKRIEAQYEIEEKWSVAAQDAR